MGWAHEKKTTAVGRGRASFLPSFLPFEDDGGGAKLKFKTGAATDQNNVAEVDGWKSGGEWLGRFGGRKGLVSEQDD